MAIVKRPRADGTVSYQVKVATPDGGWFPTATFSDLLEAQAHELELKKRARKKANANYQDAKRITEEEFWEVWSVENRTEVSAGWILSQDQMHRDYIAPHVGKVILAKVTPVHIGRVMNGMAKLGRGPQTRLHVYNLLNQMFSDAIGYYQMAIENPVKEEYHRPKLVKVKREFLLPGQAWKLLEICQEHYAGPGIWLQTLAGLRPEAMHALDWSSVLWDLDQILVRRAYKRKVDVIEEFPKGKTWEYVPLVPALKEYLEALWYRCGRPAAGFVVQGPKGGMISYSTYRKAVQKLCVQAGVPAIDPHELRHTCSELFVQQGASQEDLRRLLNHASASSTQHYIHRTDERLRGIADRVKPELRLVVGKGLSQNTFPNGKERAVSTQDEGVTVNG